MKNEETKKNIIKPPRATIKLSILDKFSKPTSRTSFSPQNHAAIVFLCINWTRAGAIFFMILIEILRKCFGFLIFWGIF